MSKFLETIKRDTMEKEEDKMTWSNEQRFINENLFKQP